jgi:hypothetical protein
LSTTTATPTIPTRVNVATGHADTLNALLRLHREGIVHLPADFLETVTTADTITRAAETASRETGALEALTGRRLGMDAVYAAVKAGEDPLDAASASWEHTQSRDQARERHEVMLGVSHEASNRAHAAVRVGAYAFGDEMYGALVALLEEAKGPGQVMLGARDFDWTDPAAVHRAEEPEQAAFAALVPMADRHDLIRASAVALALQAPDWQGIEGFAGHGVEHYLIQTGAPIRWRFAPVGHAVRRLAIAATETPAE